MLPSFKLLNEIIYTYPLIMGIAWGVSFHLAKSLSLIRNFEKFTLYYWGLFISSWIGAKLFFIMTSEYINTGQLIRNENFWLGGGFVFYGGAIFGALFFLLHKKITKQNINKYSFTLPALALGHGIGRIGCFFAGCCYGVDLPEVYHIHLFPTQLIEAAFLIILSRILYKRFISNKDVFMIYLVSYSVFRFLIEFFRGDIVRGSYLGFSTSQVISLIIILIVICFKTIAGKHKLSSI